ncbi:hypothetical protein NHQ30_002059 [Ciborinia camelliae]|nr:hypothetical protein NHQ30_002059 [Ciborinia camelliae]
MLGIATAATQVTRLIGRVSRDLNSAGKDISRLGTNITTFSLVMMGAHETLKKHYQNDHDAKVLGEILGIKLLKGLVDEFMIVMKGIERLKPRLRTIRRKSDLLARLKWLFMKTEVHALRDMMDVAKTTISIMLHMVTIALLKKQHTPQQFEKLMRENRDYRHKIQEMERLLKVSIRALRQQEADVNASIHQRSVRAPEMPGAFVAHDLLIERAEVLAPPGHMHHSYSHVHRRRKSHRSPTRSPVTIHHEPALPSPRSVRVNREGSRHHPTPVIIIPSESVEIDAPSPVSKINSEAERTPVEQDQGAPATREFEGNEEDIHPLETSDHCNTENSTHTQTNHHEGNISENTALPDPSTNSSSPPPPPRPKPSEVKGLGPAYNFDATPTNLSNVQEEEEERDHNNQNESEATHPPQAPFNPYESVIETNNTLFTSPSTTKTTRGFINNRRAKCDIDPFFSDNLMSMHEAKKLGLQIELVSPDEEPVWYDFGNGVKGRKVGEVRFEWKVADRGEFGVRCSVCDREMDRIVFGKSFLRRREYNWEKEGEKGRRD